MWKFILKRIAKAVPMIFLITIVCFLLIQFSPYDAIDYITTPQMDAATIERMKRVNGLDEPMHIQYLKWVKNLLQGNLGYSIISHESIAESLATKIPNTVKLILPSYLFAYFLAILLGLIAGGNEDRLIGRVIDWLSSLGLSVPSFWMAMLLVYLFSYKLDLLPVSGMHSVGEKSFGDFLWHYILPFVSLVFAFLPDLILYVQSSTKLQLKEDYATVQRAMGATKVQILLRHVSKNVLLPLITKLGMALPLLVTGALITETMFSWPGVGIYYVKAIRAMDYPIVMTILLFSSVLVILGNLISDVSYYLLDPRIRR